MSKRATLRLAAAIIALSHAPAFGADRAAIAARAAQTGYGQAEEAYLRTAAAGDAASIYALGEFYAAHGLWPETIAAINRLKAPDAAAEQLRVEAQYRFGRYGETVAASEGKHALAAFRAMGLTRLGAFAEAAATFDNSAPPIGLESEFRLSAAEAYAFSGDARRALQALDAAAKAGLQKSQTARFQFLRGETHRAAGEEARAQSQFQRAADHAADEWAMRARAALAKDARALRRLALEWRSDAFDRDLLMRQGELALASADFETGFDAYARVTARFPQSDAALRAQAGIGARLGDLFSADLAVEDVARLFFAHVSFAPPGREGDALIRQAADRLKMLGLYAEAASLLDHQVFKRLRGAERARIAADLAGLQLEARTPDAALRTLRSTRIAGLDAETVARRRLLEATALARLGKDDAALALLEPASTPAETALRASIHWDAERWSAAAADYAAAFAAAPSNRDAAMRAATAFLLADDRAGYRGFANEAAARLAGTREGDVIKSMGGVDRDAFLSTFMEKYRALYAAKS